MISMPIIEKNKENQEYIDTLYEMKVVKFENTILKSDQYTYSISYFPPKNIFDVVLEDDLNNKLVNYEAREILSNSTLKYFKLIKDEIIKDNFGNEFKCLTHYVEFELW